MEARAYEHVITGEFGKVIPKGSTQELSVLSGGGHTRESIEKLKQLRPDIADQIVFEEAANGVTLAKIPRSGISYDQAKLIKRSAGKGFGYYDEAEKLFGKTLYPKNWTDEKIQQAVEAISNGKGEKVVRGTTTYIDGEFEGVKIQVLIQEGRVATAYPIFPN